MCCFVKKLRIWLNEFSAHSFLVSFEFFNLVQIGGRIDVFNFNGNGAIGDRIGAVVLRGNERATSDRDLELEF